MSAMTNHHVIVSHIIIFRYLFLKSFSNNLKWKRVVSVYIRDFEVKIFFKKLWKESLIYFSVCSWRRPQRACPSQRWRSVSSRLFTPKARSSACSATSETQSSTSNPRWRSHITTGRNRSLHAFTVWTNESWDVDFFVKYLFSSSGFQCCHTLPISGNQRVLIF